MRAVILAAGKGTRLEPITNTMPKGMLPLAGRPILEHVLRALRESGVGEVVIVIGYMGEAVREHFGGGEAFDVKIEYVSQKEKLGTAHALSMAEAEEDFLVLNSDTLISAETVRGVLNKHRGDATLALRRVEDVRSYGLVRLEGDRVLEVVEKPVEGNGGLINAGIYAFSPRIYEAVKKTGKSPRGEYELTSSINQLIKDGGDARGVEVGGIWEDVGTPWSYLDASRAALDTLEGDVRGEVEDFVTVKGTLSLGRNSVVRSGCYIEGPVFIGDDCVVGPNAYLRSYATLGRGCRVGNGVEIKNSIIMDGTKVPHLSYVGDSIIASNCNLGAGTKVGNLRLDEGQVKMRVRGELVDAGRRKLGCVMGENVKTGLNVMINAGRKIGENTLVGPGVIVYHDLEPGSVVLKKQGLETR